MAEPTKVRLARALQEAGLPVLAARATNGEFDDYESKHAIPKIVLVRELHTWGQPGKVFAERVKAGEFDNTKEEGEAWYEREGKTLIQSMPGPTPAELRVMLELAEELGHLAIVCRKWLWHEVGADLELAAHSIKRRAAIGLPSPNPPKEKPS